MTSAERRPIWKNEYLLLFVLTSLMFAGLFVRFIIGDYAYMYVDVGADTMDINYATYHLFSDLFRSGSDSYVLSAGLGMDLSSYYYQYLNPYAILMVLLPARLLPWAILLSTYLKLLTIAFAGYLFYRRIVKDSFGALIGALVWTFSSYVMLWGQHYGFCTAMALFTVFMYLVQCYLDGDKRWKQGALVLMVTAMLFANYYFMYMSAIFSALYLVGYCLVKKFPWKKLLGKIAGLAGMGILGVLIGGTCVVTILNSFFTSARAGALNARNLGSQLMPYEGKWLFPFLTRLFSNNLMGVGDDYSGNGNYYEMAMISTSLLLLFAVIYLIMKKQTRRTMLILTGMCILMLILPITGKLFTMNVKTQRWSFVLCFLEALAVGLFLAQIRRERDRRKLWICALGGVGLTILGVAGMYVGQEMGYYELNQGLLGSLVVILLVYGVLILLLTYERFRKAFPVVLTLVVLGELLWNNYPTINNRESPTRNQLAVEYYQDGTTEAADYIEQQDDSVYRVAKTYESASENDPMVQGYNGLSVYMAANPQELIDYKEMYEGEGISINFVNFDNDNFLRNTLLGVKYLIANQGENPASSLYEPVAEVGSKSVYENKEQVPFGYLYDSCWDVEEIEEMDHKDRSLAAVSGFYYSEGEASDEGTVSARDGEESASQEEGHVSQAEAVSAAPYGEATLPQYERVSILEHITSANDCEMEVEPDGVVMKNMYGDPNLTAGDLDEYFADEDKLYALQIDVEASEKTELAIYYQTEGDEGFVGDKIYIFPISRKHHSWTYMVPGGITDLRIDVNTEISRIKISNLDVLVYDKDEMGLTALQESQVENVTFDNDTYTASVTNEGEQTAMLCIPLLYSEGWQARVDGDVVAVYDINSGLCGMEIPSGEHEVVMEYVIPHEMAGILATGAGMVIFLILYPGYWLYRRRGVKV